MKKDLKFAYQFYEKSTQGGNLIGIYKLGQAHHHGYSGITSLGESMKYFKIAGDAGLYSALNNYAIRIWKGF
jgi:hypothetical protein